MNSRITGFLEKKILQRDDFKQLLFSSIQAESFNFSRRLALIWLEKYPGDLEIQYILSRIISREGEIDEAREILGNITRVDPEFIEAQELLTKLCEQENVQPSSDVLACVYAMGRTVYADFQIPEWSFLFRTSWQAYLANHFENAEQLIQQVLVKKPNLSLAAILHHRIVLAKPDLIASDQLARIYHERFPDSIYFTLNIADTMMKERNEFEAVELLHECVGKDSVGIVPRRIWGDDYRYKSLWPATYDISLDVTIPIEVVSYLGLNTLPEGEILASAEPVIPEPPERLLEYARNSDPISKGKLRGSAGSATSTVETYSVQAVDEIFERLAKKLKQPDLSRTDGRYPVYVILSLKSKLVEKYGKQTFLVLDAELQKLTASIRSQRGWGGIVIYPDDPITMATYGLTAIDQIDPWKIKNSVVDIDRALAKKGEMIGALLIVGGSDVVPHHQLPNPTDDLDISVASDNPYASIDGNYFVQEWPVGRLPDEGSGDAGFLLSQIRTAISNHVVKSEPASFINRLAALFRFFQTRIVRKGITQSAIGYTAAVWQIASRSVFRVIGIGQKVFTSPPEYSGSIRSETLSGAAIGYFNLHGLEDSADWYGQKELGDQDTHLDYPIALSPREIYKNGAAPEVILSEACYGGHVSGKSEESSIALKYLGIGAGAFIGSTCVSYGSIGTPLIGADLLAFLFWKNLQSVTSSGEAFSLAKLDFVKEMKNRQGFLDGEDQKTLLSFVHYGDPLFSTKKKIHKGKRLVQRLSSPDVSILSENEEFSALETEIPAKTIQEVKKMAEIYLPGLEEVNIAISQQKMTSDRSSLAGKHPTSKDEQKTAHVSGIDRTVITISRTVPVEKHIHHHYLRARIGKSGQLEKVAVSR